MNSYIKDVRRLSHEIMNKSRHVKINYNKIKPLKDFNLCLNKVAISSEERKIDAIKKEIFINSINYCFWYGSSDIRPNNSSSSKLHSIMSESTDKLHEYIPINHVLKQIIRRNRFPLIEERCNHIDEVYEWVKTINFWNLVTYKNSPEDLFNLMVTETSCFGTDLFLKRAQLVFMSLYRTHHFFEDFVKTMTVPADYQIPKILNQLKLTEYSSSLNKKIKNNELIQKGSLEEVEIRAATIIVCDKLAEIHNASPNDIDWFLFFALRKNYSDIPFHLTITTDY